MRIKKEQKKKINKKDSSRLPKNPLGVENSKIEIVPYHAKMENGVVCLDLILIHRAS